MCSVADRVRVIEESTSTQAVLFNINASDSDLANTVNTEIEFSLEDSSLPFAVNPTTGSLTVSGTLNVKTYSVVVVVTDNGTPRLNSSAVFTVVVVPDNEYAPVFQNTPLTASVPENTNSFTTTESFTVTDNDTTTDQGRVNVTIAPSNYSSYLSVVYVSQNCCPGVTVFQLQLGTQLNRETLPTFMVTLIATDNSDPQFRKTSTANVTIMVSDVNDNAPEFLNTPYAVSVAENATIGQPVFQVNATDADEGVNAELSYTLIGTGTDKFEIDPTGLITVKGKLLQAAMSRYLLNVRVTDLNGAPGGLTATTIVNVTVLEVNDNYPQFVVPSPGEDFLVPENASIGTVIVNITVTDIDVGEPGEVTLSILESGLPFAINGNLLIVNGTLDYEVSKTL